jgi:hypothetical protein
LLLLLATTAQPLQAQPAKTNAASLIGAWAEQTDSAYEIKLISPTHVFFYVRSMVNDTAFAAGAGTYTHSGNQYTENLQYGSFDTKGIKATYAYGVQGNNMTQQGTLILADGTKIPISHTFKRIEGATQNSGKHIGTWNQLSSTFLNDSGAKASHTNATHIRYQIITPTHWMRISLANGQFENAFGGTYTTTGDKTTIKVDFASHPSMIGVTAELTQKIDGNRMTWAGPVKDAQGKQINDIVDVFERVDAKR